MNEIDHTRRLSMNSPGRFYTTEECDGCAYCAAVAPTLFDYEKELNKYFVSRQPQTASEEDQALEAVEDCPLDAIHCGESPSAKETRDLG